VSDEEDNLRGRIPPHNESAERAVLGALLQDPERMADVHELVRAEDFFSKRHRIIFEAFVSLSERNVAVDLLSVGGLLGAEDNLAGVGGNSYLADLTAVVSSAAHLMHHAEIVSECAVLRRLISEATDVIERAFATPPDGDSVRESLDEAEHRIFKITENRERTGAVPIAETIADAFRRIDNASGRKGVTGVPSGFYDLDDMLSGFNRGELTIIAARPSMGKTALVLNVMDHAVTHRPDWMDHEPAVLFFSLEMGKLSIVQRMLCARARVDAHKLRTGRIHSEDYAELARAAGELESAKLFIDDTPGLSIMAMRSRARRVKHNHGLDMIVIDYLQLMTGKGENRQQEISTISRSLKELARELEVPVIALSQLSRAVESREDKRPLLSDLRESGSIEQDADVVLMLYRQEYYNQTEENQGKAEIVCAKQRNGPTGSVKLQFLGSILKFDNPEPSMAEPISL
jgi:replicative DNA helicase